MKKKKKTEPRKWKRKEHYQRARPTKKETQNLDAEKNKFPLVDQAFKLVADAWAILNDVAKKAHKNNELTLFSKVKLTLFSKVKKKKKKNLSFTDRELQRVQWECVWGRERRERRVRQSELDWSWDERVEIWELEVREWG